MNYRDYIWDLGGTLLDNYEISTQAFVDTLKTFGKQASHDEVHSKLKESTDAAIARFIPDQPQFLKAYKEKEITLARDSAVGKMLADGKFDSKVTELLRKVVNDYEPKWTENNELENAQEIIEKMQSKYPDFVVKETQSGFTPATPVKSTGNEEQDAFISGFLGR